MVRRALTLCIAVSARLAEALTFAMMALIVIEIVSRGLAGVSLMIVDEMAGYLLVGILFLGMTASFRSGSLLRVEFMLDAMPERPRRLVEALFDLVGFAFVAVLDRALIDFVLSTFGRGMRAPTQLGTPLWIPQAVMPLGATLLAAALLASAAGALRDALAGQARSR